MDQATQKPSLLRELAKRKMDARKAGHSLGHFGKNKAAKFRRDDKHVFIPRGGRNAQGKP